MEKELIIELLKEAIKRNLIKYSGRHQGNTTRLIDLAIQLLFEGFTVEVRDHHQHGLSKEANVNLFNRILERIHNEHQFSIKNLKIDRKRFIIKHGQVVKLVDT